MPYGALFDILPLFGPNIKQLRLDPVPERAGVHFLRAIAQPMYEYLWSQIPLGL